MLNLKNEISCKLSIVILLLIFGFFNSFSQFSNECKVTYVANEGFLIETANHKILVDALFGNIKGNWCEQPSDSVASLMISGDTPFIDIDIVLVTHYHSDHFNESMVIDFLVNNHQSILVIPEQVNEILQKNNEYTQIKNRIRSINSRITPDTSFIIDKIDINALRLNHGEYFEPDSITGEPINLHKDVENLAYLINMDGFTVFHSGDGSRRAKSQFTEYNFADRKIDIAFLDRTFLAPEGQEIINELINSRQIILMHIAPSKVDYYQTIIKNIPELNIFNNSLESKCFRK